MNRPKADIVVFTCNWDGLSCVEAAAQEGYCYPASVKVVRVSCLSRVHHGLILKAFELGAAGVMLLGCEPGNCQFDVEGGLVRNEYDKARELLHMLGLGQERLSLASIRRGDGYSFVRQATAFVEELQKSQPAARVQA